MCFAPQRRALFRDLNYTLPKVARTCGVLYISTSKCASRHNGVHFFNISTAKSGPTMVCFVTFWLGNMCFARQQRALFRDLNFQKWSGNGVFCTFWLRNVLRATTACTFSTSQLPKVVRTPSKCFVTFWLGNVLRATTACNFFNISTGQKLAPQNGVFCEPTFDLEMCFGATRAISVQLFISHLGGAGSCTTAALAWAYFSTLRSHKTTKKHSVSRLSFATFESRTCNTSLLSSDLFSSDSSPCWLLFHLSILSEVFVLPNFLRLMGMQRTILIGNSPDPFKDKADWF